MIDLKPAVLAALSALPACTREAYEAGKTPLPLVVISDAERKVVSRADGADYLEEYQIAADVYALSAGGAETLCQSTDAALCALGLKRVSMTAEFDEAPYAFHDRMLYRALLRGETLYQ